MPNNLVGVAACASNALELDYHLEEFIKWHAPKVDQIVINVDSSSTDDTYPVLLYLQKYTSNLNVYKTNWGKSSDPRWLGDPKLDAFKRLSTKWRIVLDIDEFLFQRDDGGTNIKERISQLDPQELHPILYYHFVGSWRTLGKTNSWPTVQWRIGSSDFPEIFKHISTDPCGSNLIGIKPSQYPPLNLLHFGCVRQRDKLLLKWQDHMQRYFSVDSKATKSWLTSAENEPMIITPIEKANLEIPLFFKTPEFVRDDYEVYNQCVS